MMPVASDPCLAHPRPCPVSRDGLLGSFSTGLCVGLANGKHWREVRGCGAKRSQTRVPLSSPSSNLSGGSSPSGTPTSTRQYVPGQTYDSLCSSWCSQHLSSITASLSSTPPALACCFGRFRVISLCFDC